MLGEALALQHLSGASSGSDSPSVPIFIRGDQSNQL
jgi:hypothetical protein